MKRFFCVMISCVLLFSLTACGNDGTERGTESEAVNEAAAGQQAEEGEGPDMEKQPEAEPETDTAGQPATEPEADSAGQAGADMAAAKGEENRALVVYFSWSGNTESIANAIVEQTGADVFEIVPEEAYIDDYNALLDIAAQEKEKGVRPAIAGSIEDIAQYDIIYVGFPNWWSDMPMILYTFFDSYDLSGITIAPFCTSGGSGLSGTVDSIRELEPDAEVLDGLHIGSSSAAEPDSAVTDWLGSLGLAE